MKNILLTLIFIFALSAFNIEPSYADCFLFDGTYIGAVVTTGPDGKKASKPLFIVVANQHIVGFSAQEDQKTHGPSGSSFNLGDLTVSSTYTLSLTTDNSILIKSKDDTLNGKAKLSTVEGGSSSFSGFYNADATSDFVPGNFLNVGSDGGAILKFATREGKVVHAFGKINDSGEFVQVFPEKGKGPHVTINFDGDSADLEATVNGNSTITSLNKFASASCSNTSSSGSSTSGAPSNKPELVANFQDILDGISSITTSKSLIGAKDEIKELLSAIRVVKYTLLNLPTKDCSNQLAKRVQNLSSAIENVRKAATCTSSCLAILLALDEDNLIIQNKSTVDETGNGILDLCEEYSQFSGEKPISITPILKNSLNAVDNLFKRIHKEAIGILGEGNKTESLFSQISKSIKVIRSSLRLPASLCNIRIKEAGSITDSAKKLDENLCKNDITDSACTSLKEKISDLVAGAIEVDGTIEVDNNKNGIADVCE